MHCFRCGRECPETQVFCDRCLKQMQANPVKQGAAVQLTDSSRRYAEAPAVRVRRQPSPEEKVVALRTAVRWLAVAVVALSLLLGIAGWLLLDSVYHPETVMPGNLGRNYTAVEPEGN